MKLLFYLIWFLLFFYNKAVPRHRGRIIRLEYEPKGSEIDTTLFLVGKGITYDTGGADVKAGGHMAGMVTKKINYR
jgi:leucyl aminopeptidase